MKLKQLWESLDEARETHNVEEILRIAREIHDLRTLSRNELKFYVEDEKEVPTIN